MNNNRQTLITEVNDILKFMQFRKTEFDEKPEYIIYPDTNEKAVDLLARRMFILNEFFNESIESLVDILIKYHPQLFLGDEKDMLVGVVNAFLKEGKKLVIGNTPLQYTPEESKEDEKHISSNDLIIYTIKDDNIVIAAKTKQIDQDFDTVSFIKQNKIINSYFSVYGTATLDDFINASTEPDNAKYIVISPNGAKAYQIKDGMNVLDLAVFAMETLDTAQIVLVKIDNHINIKDVPNIEFDQVILNSGTVLNMMTTE